MNWNTTAKKRFAKGATKRKSDSELRQQYTGNKTFVPEFEVRPTPIIDPPDCMTSLGRLSFHSVSGGDSSSNRSYEQNSSVSNDLQMLNNPMNSLSRRTNEFNKSAGQNDQNFAESIIISSTIDNEFDSLAMDPLELLEISPIKPSGLMIDCYQDMTHDFEISDNDIIFFNNSQKCGESGLPARSWGQEAVDFFLLEPQSAIKLVARTSASPPSVAASVSGDDPQYTPCSYTPSFDRYCADLSSSSSTLAGFSFPTVFSPESVDARLCGGDGDDCISLLQF